MRGYKLMGPRTQTILNIKLRHLNLSSKVNFLKNKNACKRLSRKHQRSVKVSHGGDNEFQMILRPLNFQQHMRSLDTAQERREAHRGDAQNKVRKCLLLNTGLASYIPRGFYQEQNAGRRHMTAQPPPSSILRVPSCPVIKPIHRTMFDFV